MSCKFEEIRCPICLKLRKIEERQEVIFCGKPSCGFYFDRNGKKYTSTEVMRLGINTSSMPIFDSIKKIGNI